MSRRIPGAAHTPEVAHHHWLPTTRPALRPGGFGRFDRSARLLLFRMRWREAPPQPILRTVAWTFSLLLHAAALLFMTLSAPPPLAEPGQQTADTIQVRLLQRPRKPPPPPPPPKLPVRHAPERHAATAPRSGAAAQPNVSGAVAERHRAKPARSPSGRKTPAAKAPAPAAQAKSPEPVQQTPPPPKIRTEVTPLSLPEPKTHGESASPAPSQRDEPVTVPRMSVSNQTPTAGLVAPPDANPRAPMQGVTRVEMTRTPQPQIRPQAARPEIKAPSASAQVRTQAQAPAVHAAPRIDMAQAAAPAPHIDLQRMRVQTGAPALPQARPGALALPTAPRPAPVRRMPQPAASVAAAPAPATTSWVRSSAADQFQASKKAPAGKGVQLYGKHGALALSGNGSGKKKTADYIQHTPHGNSDVMTRSNNRLHYKSTRFDKYWTPLGETALQTAFRHLVEEFTYTKTIHVARGARIKCAISPLMLMSFFSCGSGNPPSPPPPTDGDRRLDMAPAKPLVEGLGPTPASSSPSPPLPTKDTTSCITAKVAGSPPPPGCPLPQTSDQW